MRKKTVAIFGISSFVGSNLAEFLKKYFRVVGTYYKNRVEMEGVLSLPCDVLVRDEVQLVMHTFQPDFTIYCVGLSGIEDCYNHIKLADALNTMGVINVTEFSERYKSKMCLISSAYIFNGEDIEHLENDTPDPGTSYGKTKVAAEFYIQKSCLNYIIFRCCSLYGRGLNPRTRNLFESIQRNLLLDQSVVLDNSIREGFLDVYYLGMIIKLSLEKNVTNRLFQISSSNLITRYEFGKTYAEVFNVDPNFIVKGSWYFPHFEGYAGTTKGCWFRMDVTNLESYHNIIVPSVKESLEYTQKRLGQDGKASTKKNKEAGLNFI